MVRVTVRVVVRVRVLFLEPSNLALILTLSRTVNLIFNRIQTLNLTSA